MSSEIDCSLGSGNWLWCSLQRQSGKQINSCFFVLFGFDSCDICESFKNKERFKSIPLLIVIVYNNLQWLIVVEYFQTYVGFSPKHSKYKSYIFLSADFVPNTSDDEGRYSIRAQANVGLFNMEKLLEALHPVLTPHQQQQYVQQSRAVVLQSGPGLESGLGLLREFDFWSLNWFCYYCF